MNFIWSHFKALHHTRSERLKQNVNSRYQLFQYKIPDVSVFYIQVKCLFLRSSFCLPTILSYLIMMNSDDLSAMLAQQFWDTHSWSHFNLGLIEIESFEIG